MAFLIGEKQKKAVTLLWKGLETPQIAAKLGVHRSTVWRWFQHPEMRAYTEKVFRRNRMRMLNKPMKNPLLEAINSPNPVRAYAAAVRALDLFHDILMKG